MNVQKVHILAMKMLIALIHMETTVVSVKLDMKEMDLLVKVRNHDVLWNVCISPTSSGKKCCLSSIQTLMNVKETLTSVIQMLNAMIQ